VCPRRNPAPPTSGKGYIVVKAFFSTGYFWGCHVFPWRMLPQNTQQYNSHHYPSSEHTDPRGTKSHPADTHAGPAILLAPQFRNGTVFLWRPHNHRSIIALALAREIRKNTTHIIRLNDIRTITKIFSGYLYQSRYPERCFYRFFFSAMLFQLAQNHIFLVSSPFIQFMRAREV